MGTGAFCSTSPVSAIAMWLLPWNPPWKETISPRPVAVLQSLIAASTALAPVGPQKCSFIRDRMVAGSMESWVCVKSSLAGVGKSSPCAWLAICRAAIATSSGWLWPSESTPAPVRKSMKTLPSRSWTKLPEALAIAIGRRRG